MRQGQRIEWGRLRALTMIARHGFYPFSTDSLI